MSSAFRSPFRRYQQAMRAQQLAGAAGADLAPDRPEDEPEAGEYALLRFQLGEHMRQLSSIHSTEAKIAAKRTMLETYEPHITAVIAAGEGTGQAVQDEIVSRLMLWHIDCGDYARGLAIAAHVLRFGLKMPEPFQRGAGCIVAEQVAEAALSAAAQGHSFPVPVLQQTLELTEGQDMPDIVRAKLHKALGFAFRAAADAASEADSSAAGSASAAREQALAHLRRALALVDKIGVKKEIERLAARHNKEQARHPAPGGGEGKETAPPPSAA